MGLKLKQIYLSKIISISIRIWGKLADVNGSNNAYGCLKYYNYDNFSIKIISLVQYLSIEVLLYNP